MGLEPLEALSVGIIEDIARGAAGLAGGMGVDSAGGLERVRQRAERTCQTGRVLSVDTLVSGVRCAVHVYEYVCKCGLSVRRFAFCPTTSRLRETI